MPTTALRGAWIARRHPGYAAVFMGAAVWPTFWLRAGAVLSRGDKGLMDFFWMAPLLGACGALLLLGSLFALLGAFFPKEPAAAG